MSERFKFVVAVHLFFIEGNRILLLRRFNTGWQDGNYSVVAGHADGNEKIIDAAIREAKEEAGVSLRSEDLTVVEVMHRISDDERIDFFIKVNNWRGKIKNREPEKCDDLSWFDIDNIPENTIPYIKKAIENYINKVYFDEFGF